MKYGSSEPIKVVQRVAHVCGAQGQSQWVLRLARPTRVQAFRENRTVLSQIREVHARSREVSGAL